MLTKDRSETSSLWSSSQKNIYAKVKGGRDYF